MGAFATEGGETEKKKVTEKKDKTEKVDPKKESSDSSGVVKTNSTIKAKFTNTAYKPEQFLEQDSLDESGSVVTFNFIQYIIENFKFSEEIF